MKLRKLDFAAFCLAIMVALALCPTANGKPRVVRTFVQDGKTIDEIVMDGRPPATFRAPVAVVPSTDVAAGIVTLQNVPAFNWSYGCSTTSAAMMMGYYDNNGYPNMYAGPANAGVCPMNNETYWGNTTYPGVTCGECPLSATHQGVDGRNLLGHVDDYWRDYNNCDSDPYIAGAWTEHTQGECTGDFMGTNQSKYANCDGATTFYFDSGGAPVDDYTGSEPSRRDGCHGMKLFVQSRGYTVTTNFSQYIQGYKGNSQGFTFANFQSEINAGRPVLIQVDNHTMLGYGYDSTNQTVYVHDTWDHNSHSMTWGGSYSGLTQYGVTVLHLGCNGSSPTINTQPVGDTRCTGQSITFTVGASGSMLAYQWRKNYSNISGANGSSYTIGSIASSDGGNYDCVVSNPCGSTTSSIATLTVSAAPTITTNPADQTVFTGATATFSVTTSGTSLSYQWQVSKDGGASYSNVSIGTGVTTASYTTSPTTITDSGSRYRCVVSGMCPPSVTSSSAILSAQVGVVLLSEGFEGAFAPSGWTQEFSTGNVNWMQAAGDHTGGGSEEGSNNALLYASGSGNHKTYLITPAIAFGGCGAAATLEFWHKQAGTTRQDTLEVDYRTTTGGAWTMLASYTSSVGSWTKRTIALPNLTSTYYIGFLGNAKGGNGVCIDNVVVTQGCCPPAIAAHPSPVSTCAGTSATFSVTGSGIGLGYQWRKNAVNISGAIGTSLTINPVSTSDAGSYDCVVSNACGSVTSNAATLTVTGGPTISDVKLMPDGQSVALLGKAVTYAGTNFFYIEETNRSAGIRIERTNHGLNAGVCADLVGVLSTNANSERFIAASSAVADGTGSVPVIAVRNSAVGGANWQYNSITSAGQKGTSGMAGLNNIGLLVKTWGSYTPNDATSFVVDDGSGWPVTCMVQPGFQLSAGWQYVTVVGVSSLFKLNDTTFVPCVLVKDVQAY